MGELNKASPHTPDEYMNIPNYKIFWCDNGRGAGACIVVKDTLNPNSLVLNNHRQPGVEGSAKTDLPISSAINTGNPKSKLRFLLHSRWLQDSKSRKNNI